MSRLVRLVEVDSNNQQVRYVGRMNELVEEGTYKVHKDKNQEPFMMQELIDIGESECESANAHSVIDMWKKLANVLTEAVGTKKAVILMQRILEEEVIL